MYAELDYEDEFYKGMLVLEVSGKSLNIWDVVRIQNGTWINEDGNEEEISMYDEVALDAIAAKLFDQWGNGFGWEEKVRI